MSQHSNELNREKRGRDTTSRSRKRFQHKCKEVRSRHNKLGHDRTSKLKRFDPSFVISPIKFCNDRELRKKLKAKA